MKQTDFIALLKPPALASWRRANIPASFTIAQAALESAWGTSRLATSAFNLFGMKAGKGWNGETIIFKTTEYADLDGDGQKDDAFIVPATWRKYSSFEHCLQDREQFLLKAKRYAPAFIHGCNASGISFAAKIVECGYATDPKYVAKIEKIISTYKLDKIDWER